MCDESITYLDSVETGDGTIHVAGSGGIVRIYLTRDGNGPMGFYDIINIMHASEDVLCVPAHTCKCWVIGEAQSMYEREQEFNVKDNTCA